MDGESRRYRRTLSETNQFYLPPDFRLYEEFFIQEPGILSPTDTIWIFPVAKPPVIDGEFPGEQIRKPLSPQGQLTLPKRFAEEASLAPKDKIIIERGDNGRIIISEAQPDGETESTTETGEDFDSP